MKKKIIALSLATLLTAAFLAGCGTTKSTGSTDVSSSNSSRNISTVDMISIDPVEELSVEEEVLVADVAETEPVEVADWSEDMEYDEEAWRDTAPPIEFSNEQNVSIPCYTEQTESKLTGRLAEMYPGKEIVFVYDLDIMDNNNQVYYRNSNELYVEVIDATIVDVESGMAVYGSHDYRAYYGYVEGICNGDHIRSYYVYDPDTTNNYETCYFEDFFMR